MSHQHVAFASRESITILVPCFGRSNSHLLTLMIVLSKLISSHPVSRNTYRGRSSWHKLLYNNNSIIVALHAIVCKLHHDQHDSDNRNGSMFGYNSNIQYFHEVLRSKTVTPSSSR